MGLVRDLSVDRFRGLAVFLMIIVQIWRDFYNLEFLSKLGSHKASTGLTVIEGMQFADLIAPMFLFAIALTYKKSFDSRCLKNGYKQTKKHFLKRYILLIGLGGILRSVESLVFWISHGYVEKQIDYLFFCGLIFLVLCIVGKFVSLIFKNDNISKLLSDVIFLLMTCIAAFCFLVTARDFFVQILNKNYLEFKVWGYWEALQAIGAAGLVTLLFIRLKTIKRFAITTIIFVAYFIFHEIGNHQEIISIYAQQGGFLGIWGQSCIVLYGTVLSDLYYADSKRLSRFIPGLSVFGIVAVVILQFVQPTMRSVSPSYILINVFISGTVFAAIKLCSSMRFKFDLFNLFGKNALIIYILQYVLIYGTKELIGYEVLNNASDLYSMCFTIIMISILAIISYWLDKTGKIIKL